MGANREVRGGGTVAKRDSWIDSSLWVFAPDIDQLGKGGLRGKDCLVRRIQEGSLGMEPTTGGRHGWWNYDRVSKDSPSGDL